MLQYRGDYSIFFLFCQVLFYVASLLASLSGVSGLTQCTDSNANFFIVNDNHSHLDKSLITLYLSCNWESFSLVLFCSFLWLWWFTKLSKQQRPPPPPMLQCSNIVQCSKLVSAYFADQRCCSAALVSTYYAGMLQCNIVHQSSAWGDVAPYWCIIV